MNEDKEHQARQWLWEETHEQGVAISNPSTGDLVVNFYIYFFLECYVVQKTKKEAGDDPYKSTGIETQYSSDLKFDLLAFSTYISNK